MSRSSKSKGPGRACRAPAHSINGALGPVAGVGETRGPHGYGYRPSSAIRMRARARWVVHGHDLEGGECDRLRTRRVAALRATEYERVPKPEQNVRCSIRAPRRVRVAAWPRRVRRNLTGRGARSAAEAEVDCGADAECRRIRMATDVECGGAESNIGGIAVSGGNPNRQAPVRRP